ncbi:MAG: class I SAM-dependent methyltransferase [Oscillospiraceae bacterium]|nr:class I SAM-dependent methyltransferase [Oscillospiraceae bacterium]
MKKSDWYKYGWSLDIKNHSWTEDTENQVDFVIKALDLAGGEKILDLACGYGRHSLAFARRGFTVVGVDITKEYIDDAIFNARKESLSADFYHNDIRGIDYLEKFDVVLNLADGAIGYLENDAENLKIFDVAARTLKSGGKHFIDVCNADHAERFFPKKNWEAGKKSLALAQFDWDSKTRRMKYGGWSIPFGKEAEPPQINMDEINPTRLYSLEELRTIYARRGMKIISSYSNYYGKEATEKELQLLVYSHTKGVKIHVTTRGRDGYKVVGEQQPLQTTSELSSFFRSIVD